MEKTYLGDGAYVQPGCYAGEIILTTSNGIRDTNTIVLGPQEFVELAEFMRKYARENGIPV